MSFKTGHELDGFSRKYVPKPFPKQPAVSHLEKGDTMGERIGRIGQIQTDFLDSKTRISSQKIKKNPFGSARSAQSVLPLYRFFSNEKLLNDE